MINIAREVIERLVDDLDGSEGHKTVEFALDGQTYSIDLSNKHDSELRTKLNPYLEAARRVRPEGGRPGRGTRSASDRDRNAEIRAWAESEGAELPARGRIAQAVIASFEAKDGDALREALGLELVEDRPKRRRKGTEAEFSEAAA